MSPSAHIRTVTTSRGAKRFVVRYRMGGRTFPLLHGGSFVALKHARARRDFILGEMAAGRDPRVTLAALTAPETTTALLERFDTFIASRVDVGEKTTALYRNARDRLGSLAELDPADLTPALVQSWIGECADLSPRTLQHYLSTLRQVLDFCDIEPNPARSRKVKLPIETTPEVAPPTCVEWHRIRAKIARRFLLPLRLIEADGLRVGEALSLRWGDVDFVACRLRISKARTKGRTAGQRWLPVPPELMDEVADLVPLEDRQADQPVFAGIVDWQLRQELARACRDAGLVVYSPHDLRHLRCSLWIAHGFDHLRVKVWSGHSRASMLTDVYGHVIVDPREDEWREFWLDVYAAERAPREAPVRHQEDA